MACRPQSNPSSISSDGVPPELLVLGLRRLPGAPVRYTGLTSRRREAAGVDRLNDLVARSTRSSVWPDFASTPCCPFAFSLVLATFQKNKIVT